MSVIVMPLGVIAAVYLHEYARKNWFTRLIRIAVVNLAGCPPLCTVFLAWVSLYMYWVAR